MSCSGPEGHENPSRDYTPSISSPGLGHWRFCFAACGGPVAGPADGVGGGALCAPGDLPGDLCALSFAAAALMREQLVERLLNLFSTLTLRRSTTIPLKLDVLLRVRVRGASAAPG